jgi:hypothetical protein
MEASQPRTRIVKFPTGEELTVEEAGSGRFVFAAGREPDTIFAFERESAEQELEKWAQQRELGDDLARAREVVDRLPDDPGAEVDEAAERARVAQINDRLRAFSTEIGMPMEAPEFIERAHEAGIFDSAILYQLSSYRSPALGLSTNCTDVRWYLPQGALSARTYGFNVVLLYDQANYGPVTARRTPMLSLVGTAVTALCPRPVLSVIFS